MSRFSILSAVAKAVVSFPEGQQVAALENALKDYTLAELVKYCSVTDDFKPLVYAHIIKHLREAASAVAKTELTVDTDPADEVKSEEVPKNFFELIEAAELPKGSVWGDVNAADEEKKLNKTSVPDTPTPAPSPASSLPESPGEWVAVAARNSVGKGAGRGVPAPEPKKKVVNFHSNLTRTKVCSSCVFGLGEHPKDDCWFIPTMQYDSSGSPRGWYSSGKYAWTNRRGATVRHRRLASGTWVHEIRSQTPGGRKWRRAPHAEVVQHLAKEKAARRNKQG